MWIAFTIQAFIILILAYFLQQFESRMYDWNLLIVEGIGCYCGVSIRYSPNNNAHRFLYLMVLLSAVVFTTSFTAHFLAEKTLHYYQIQTITEIVDGGYNLAGDTLAFSKVSEQNQVKLSSEIKIEKSNRNLFTDLLKGTTSNFSKLQ